MKTPLNADRLLRLYPRHWRARYEDEMRALLRDTGVTPAVVFDLLRGVGREWVRAFITAPPTPVSGTRERFRNLLRSVVATLVMAGATWWLARALLKVGLSADHGVEWLIVIAFVPILKNWRLAGRQGRFKYAAAGSSGSRVNPGISRREFWVGMVLFGIGLTVWWMVWAVEDRSWDDTPQLTRITYCFLLFQLMHQLRGTTKASLSRARALAQIEAARWKAKWAWPKP